MFRFRAAAGRGIILLTNLAFERQGILMSFRSLAVDALSRSHVRALARAETRSLMSVPCTFLISHTVLSQASKAAAIRDRRGRRKEIFFRFLLVFPPLLSLALRLKNSLCSHIYAPTDLREQRSSQLPPHH